MSEPVPLFGSRPMHLDLRPVAPVDHDPEAKPFVKWAGGKTTSTPRILSHLPSKIDGAYFEPFVGAGAVFWALRREDRLRGSVVLSDLNRRLIMTWQGVRDGVEDVLRLLAGYRESYEADAEKTYYETREEMNSGWSSAANVAVAAAFIFLNKTCVNGLYRENRDGEFNVSWCHDKGKNFVDPNRLRACSRALQGVEIVCAPFWEVLRFARECDHVYADPPYMPVSATADFTAYTADGFGDADQLRLRDVLINCRDRGVNVLASNADVPRVRQIYDGFGVERIEARRAINSDGAKRGKVGELLIGVKS